MKLSISKRTGAQIVIEKEVCNSSHLKNIHGIIIKDLFRIWKEDVCPLTENGGEMARIKLFSKVQKQLRPYIEEMENAKMILSKEEKKKN